MAAVCGGCLALMDAGVPIKAPVAGIAMGLIMEGDDSTPSSRDILGDEDHLGDMDFKVCGTANGVTAIQMDIKIAGLSRDDPRRRRSTRRARAASTSSARCSRRWPAPRPDLSQVRAAHHARSRSSPTRSASSSGPAARPSRASSTRPASPIDVEDDGTVNIASTDNDAVKKALDIIKGLTTEPEVGAIYKGTVKRIADFGAFIEILPGTDGLLHVSEMAHTRVEQRDRRA